VPDSTRPSEQAAIKVAGRALEDKYKDALTSVRVEQSVHLPDAFTLRFDDPDFKLLDEMKFSVRDVERLLYHESGLLGMSGVSSDMRDLLASDVPSAKLAVEVFVYRANRELGSLAAALGGVDAVVFTAGIGENQPEIRARICRGARWLGVELDEAANLSQQRRISAGTSAVSVHVVPTDEELMIARHVASVLGG